MSSSGQMLAFKQAVAKTASPTCLFSMHDWARNARRCQQSLVWLV